MGRRLLLNDLSNILSRHRLRRALLPSFTNRSTEAIRWFNEHRRAILASDLHTAAAEVASCGEQDLALGPLLGIYAGAFP